MSITLACGPHCGIQNGKEGHCKCNICHDECVHEYQPAGVLVWNDKNVTIHVCIKDCGSRYETDNIL